MSAPGLSSGAARPAIAFSLCKKAELPVIGGTPTCVSWLESCFAFGCLLAFSLG
jgi:hypothetical protein